MKSLFDSSNKTLHYHWAGILFFSVYGFLTILFYKERMIAYDSANYCLEIEQYKHYCLPHGRWASVFTQFIPLTLLKLNCSLKTFLISYSFAFTLFFYLIYVIIIWLRNYAAALVLMIALTIGFRWMFYYAISELFSGMALSALIYALADNYKNNQSVRQKIIYGFTIATLSVTVSFFHQLALFSALFSILWVFIYKKHWKDIWFIGFICIVIVWSYIRIKVFSVADYTSGKILSAEKYFELLPNLKQLPCWDYFIRYIKDYAKWILYLSVFSSLLLMMRKKFIEVLFFWAFTFGYAILISLTYYKGESSLMMENYFPPIGFFAGIVFLSAALNYLKNMHLNLICTFLILIGFINIVRGSSIQTERLKHIERLLDYSRNFSSHKFMLKEENLNIDIIGVPWAMPFETLLLSSIDNQKNSLTINYEPRNENYTEYLKNAEDFIGPLWSPKWNFILTERISLPTEPYYWLNTSQDDSLFGQKLNEIKAKLKLEQVHEEVQVPYHQTAYVQVKILNQSGFKLPSVTGIKNNIKIGYKIFDLNGQVVDDEKILTNLEVDVLNEFIQDVKIKSPDKKGDYILQIDLISNNSVWWNNSCKMKLKIPGKDPLRFI